MVKLGRFHKEGQGGLPRNSAAAVALWRAPMLKGENPWALVLLAPTLETGEGSTADPIEALAL